MIQWQLLLTAPDGTLQPCDLWGVDQDMIDAGLTAESSLSYCVVPIPAGYTPHSLVKKEN